MNEGKSEKSKRNYSGLKSNENHRIIQTLFPIAYC